MKKLIPIRKKNIIMWIFLLRMGKVSTKENKLKNDKLQKEKIKKRWQQIQNNILKKVDFGKQRNVQMLQKKNDRCKKEEFKLKRSIHVCNYLQKKKRTTRRY